MRLPPNVALQNDKLRPIQTIVKQLMEKGKRIQNQEKLIPNSKKSKKFVFLGYFFWYIF
jgi:hypothetical protein